MDVLGQKEIYRIIKASQKRRNENAVGSKNWNVRESEIKQILDNNPSLKEWYNETYIGK